MCINRFIPIEPDYSDSKIDWGNNYKQFLKKYDWVEGVSKDTLKTCYYKHMKKNISTGGDDGSND
jgi:hypothetical protein